MNEKRGSGEVTEKPKVDQESEPSDSKKETIEKPSEDTELKNAEIAQVFPFANKVAVTPNPYPNHYIKAILGKIKDFVCADCDFKRSY